MNNKLHVADEVVLGYNQHTFVKLEKNRILKPIFVVIHVSVFIKNEVIWMT